MNRYLPAADRYDGRPYRRCGRSGLPLPALSLGLWNNFGAAYSFENARALVRTAFDLGITHFDLANNYGPRPDPRKRLSGAFCNQDLKGYRDELIVSTKAGYGMWPGPYGDGGSRKYLLASLDQSLKRLGLEYADIFYSHRMDFETPLEETMGALDAAVRSGKALYAGLSNYDPDRTRAAVAILRDLGTPCLIHQPAYNLLRRDPERGMLGALEAEGVGCIAFSPLSQGMLSDKRQVPAGHSVRVQSGPFARHVERVARDPGRCGRFAASSCRRPGPATVIGADGFGLGVAEAGDLFRADRSQPGRTIAGKRAGFAPAGVFLARTGYH